MKTFYVVEGDYLYPRFIPDDGKIPREREDEVTRKREDKLLNGKYARMREEYLREDLKLDYEIMLFNGSLGDHLMQVQEEAEELWNAIYENYLDSDTAPPKEDKEAWETFELLARHCADYAVQRYAIYPEEYE